MYVARFCASDFLAILLASELTVEFRDLFRKTSHHTFALNRLSYEWTYMNLHPWWLGTILNHWCNHAIHVVFFISSPFQFWRFGEMEPRYLMSESWTNTNKALVFFVLVSSNAVTRLFYTEGWDGWYWSSGRWSVFVVGARNVDDTGVSKNRGTPKWMVYYGKPY